MCELILDCRVMPVMTRLWGCGACKERGMNEANAFGEDVKFSPWWWEWAPRAPRSESELPVETEIAVVGSGFTALSAALELCRAGRQVTLFESGPPGHGASSRNGGQVGSGNQRFSVARMNELFGDTHARELLQEGVRALDFLATFIESEDIDCHFRRVGRYRGAIRPSHFEPMVRDHEALAKVTGVEFQVVPKSEQHAEIGTDFYHGGVVLPGDGSLHPALYHQGLLERVEQAGGRVVPFTPVTAFRRERQRMVLSTTRGEVSAGDVVVATNGYTGPATPDYAARVVPVPSAIIATEPLDKELMQTLMPRNRVIGETRRVFYYYRACPERRRILFGGRNAKVSEATRWQDFSHLYRGMVEIFPQLAGVKVTHCWTGYTGYTRDTFPHTGSTDRLHYALGYCGSGVARATYLGFKLAERLLGRAGATTAWDELVFRRFAFPAASRAFLPAAVGWYRLRDRFDF